MQFGNIKAFTMLCNHHQCLHSHLLILSPHFPAKPGFMSSTPHSSFPYLTTFSLLLSPFLPVLWCLQSMPITETIEKNGFFFDRKGTL